MKQTGKKKTAVHSPQVADGVQKIFDHHRHVNSMNEFRGSQPALLKWGIFTAIAVIIAIYLFSTSSRIMRVRVEGNRYLSDDYIKEVSGVKEDGVFYFTFPLGRVVKLKNDPLISDAHVSMKDGNIVTIEIEEKKVIGYRYEKDPVLLLADQSTAELKSEYLDIIANVPLITGFTDEEQTRLLIKAFSKVDQDMIENISEVSQFTLHSYDDQAMKILMRNGGYFIGTYRNLDKLNQYYKIYEQMTDKSLCVSASDDTNVAYTEACPWNTDTASHEYWTDEEGNIVTNTYGDQVVKHYYTDEEGNDALDENGNRIAIPIDSQGMENADPDFLEHYAAGYYASGTLDLPGEDE